MTGINLKRKQRKNTDVKQSDKTKHKHKAVDNYVIERSKDEERARLKSNKTAKGNDNSRIFAIQKWRNK